jgi:hypothetical protein
LREYRHECRGLGFRRDSPPPIHTKNLLSFGDTPGGDRSCGQTITQRNYVPAMPSLAPRWDAPATPILTLDLRHDTWQATRHDTRHDTRFDTRLDARQDDQSHAYTQFTARRSNHETNNHTSLNPCHTQPPTAAHIPPYSILSRPPQLRCSLTLRLSTLIRTCALRMSQVLSSLSAILSSTDPIGPPRRVLRDRLGILHRATLLHLTTWSSHFT